MARLKVSGKAVVSHWCVCVSASKMLGALAVVCLAFTVSARPSSKIVGGEEATLGEIKYQVALKYFGGSFCGGTVIDKSWVLTAGHCMSGKFMQGLTTTAADFNIWYEDEGEQTRQVVKVIPHPKFDSWVMHNDLTLLKVDPPFDLEAGGVVKAELPDKNWAISEGEMVLVSGWGATKEGEYMTEKLRKVKVPVISDEKCKNDYPGYSVIDTMLCAGLPSGGKDACQGDSGGPLVYGNTLVGVVSWGIGCARPNQPGVYTEVSFFVDWLNDVIANN